MDDSINLVFDKMIISGNKGWFIDINYNILFRIDLDTYVKEPAYYIPSASSERYQYRRMVCYENKLVMIPYNSNRVVIYDMEDGQIAEIHLDESFSTNNMRMCFTDAIIIDNKTYFIPARYRALACLDMETLIIEYFPKPIECICKTKNFSKNRHILSGDYVFAEDRIIIPLWQDCALLYSAPGENIFELKKIGNDNGGLYGVCYANSKIICSEKNKMKFYIIDCDTWSVKEHDLSMEMQDSASGATQIIKCDDKLYVIPSKGESIYETSLNLTDIKRVYSRKLEYANEAEGYAYADLSYTCGTMIDSKLYLYSQYDGEMLLIDCKTSTVSKISMKYKKDETIQTRIREFVRSNEQGIVNESLFLGLKDFMETI